VPVKFKVEILQNFVAFSEYMNFNMPHFKDFAMMNLLLLFLQPHLVPCIGESVIVATTLYFEHNAPLTYSLWILLQLVLQKYVALLKLSTQKAPRHVLLPFQ
jgi:hypothetical protein